ncbi:MAG: patatin-like phospholipase family protein [Candidatus Woykebacteria bacterium]
MHIHDLDVSKCQKEKIGVSYSGGANRGIVHLGIAKAFIHLGIKPGFIVGVSSGSIAAAIHAFNPDNFDTISLTTSIIKKLKRADFGLSIPQIVIRVLKERLNLQSLGDLSGFKKIVAENIPFKSFAEAKVPFAIEAANRLNSQQTWFEEGPVIEAMIASSSLPVAFPPYKINSELYVDGGVTDGLPLFKLAEEGCGTIVAINLGYAGETREPPKNLLENLFGSIDIALYQSDRYEVALVKALYPDLNIIEVRPEVAFDLPPFSFTPEKIDPLVQEAFEKSVEILKPQFKL